MRAPKRFILPLSAGLLACAGIIGGYWMVSVLGVLVLVLAGNFGSALLFAFLLDLLFGPAVGMLEVLVYPLTLLVASLALIRAFVIRHLRDRRLY